MANPDVPRSNLYMYDPANLVLVTDKEDPLYDSRVELPVEENMILNIMDKGILQNIRVVKRGVVQNSVVLFINRRLRAEWHTGSYLVGLVLGTIFGGWSWGVQQKH